MSNSDNHALCYNKATERRGIFLSKAVILERAIDLYIAGHFCKEEEKKSELLDLIIATKRMIFENKVQVFKVLGERHERGFLHNNPKLINDIISIIEHRNILAHYSQFSGGEALDKFVESGIITFVKFQNTRNFLEYKPEDLDIMEILATDCATKVIQLIGSKKASPSMDNPKRLGNSHSNKEETT